MNKELIDRINEEAKAVKTKLISNVDLSNFKNRNIITYGTFDLFHQGHIKIIDHAIEITGRQSDVYVGISSDRWNKLKNKKSVLNQTERFELIRDKYPDINIFFEDHDMPEESWSIDYDKYNIDLIIMGGDHADSLDYINEKLTPRGMMMKIVFFERTPIISSTLIKELNK